MREQPRRQRANRLHHAIRRAIVPTPQIQAPLTVISPYLDDAVFSCGGLIAAAMDPVVVTVFAGVPEAGTAPPKWGRAAGFDDALQAVLRRRHEDARALARLGARPEWLDLLDGGAASYFDPCIEGVVRLFGGHALRLAGISKSTENGMLPQHGKQLTGHEGLAFEDASILDADPFAVGAWQDEHGFPAHLEKKGQRAHHLGFLATHDFGPRLSLRNTRHQMQYPAIG
ncbi:hypothetical protein CYJ10_24370 [Cupriavidus pauculus]|uniref:PIG-L family deacetylase n=1 Tax=Cupriavidus pauculus TaxID=82633 RepID=A0A2N5C6V4_9BURK|nr:hypothetical protein CYJ10_24370 [Cupriavidus pauculus]